MEKERYKVTIVIPNYKGKDYLGQCVKSLYTEDNTRKEIIIVDNASNDGSLEEVEANFPEVKCIRLEKNYGFCRAVNVGIQNASAPYVILLNNDTVIKKDFVKNLTVAIEKDDSVFSIEPKMIQYQNQKLIDSAGTYYNVFGWAFARGKDKTVTHYRKKKKIFAACGGASIYRKDVFDQIGLFDERHFAYLEDIDVGYRAKINGYKNLYEPSAEVVHVGSASSGSRYNEFKIKLSSRNNVYLVYKNMPLVQKIINSPTLFFGFLIKYIFFMKKGYGKIYLKGLTEGMKMCRKQDKISWNRKHLKNYLKIQLELWKNIFVLLE